MENTNLPPEQSENKETYEQKIQQLRKELEMGEQRGMVSDFDPEKNLQELGKKYSE